LKSQFVISSLAQHLENLRYTTMLWVNNSWSLNVKMIKSDGIYKIMRELPKIYGDQSETLATLFLEQERYVIIERNYFARKLGEIDIIAMQGEVLHFIEVKSGKADFDPVYNVTPAKLRKVINSAHYYMKSKNLDLSFCIDALLSEVMR